jgi:hypothetical protein
MLYIYDGLNYLRDELEFRGNSLRGLYNAQANPELSRTIIWVWEGKGGNNRRRDVYPGYKGTRPQAPENIFRSVQLFRDLLKCANAFQISVDGYEGDDVVASLCRRYNETEKFIFSTDKDFRQLYGPKTKGMSNQVEDYDDKYVRLFKTLVGDPSDNIKGIPGFGKVGFSELDLDGLNEVFFGKRWELLPRFLAGIKSKCYDWAITHVEELATMWEITGFFDIEDSVLDANLTVGSYNGQLADSILKRYLQ